MAKIAAFKNKEDEPEEVKTSHARKSAASLKPKSRAASSVVLESERKPRTRAEKRAAKEAAKKKSENNKESARYEKPTSDRYKKLRGLWWGLIGVSLVLMVIVIAAQTWFTETQNEKLFYVILFIGWGFLIAALFVDFGPVRKERKRWEAEQAATGGKSKQERKLEKATKAKENSNRVQDHKVGVDGGEAARAEDSTKKKGFFWKK